MRSLPPSAAKPARMSAAMASATWRKTGKGVAQSFCNLVRIGDAETVLNDPTVIATLGRRAPPPYLADCSDPTAAVMVVTDIAAITKCTGVEKDKKQKVAVVKVWLK